MRDGTPTTVRHSPELGPTTALFTMPLARNIYEQGDNTPNPEMWVRTGVGVPPLGGSVRKLVDDHQSGSARCSLPTPAGHALRMPRAFGD